MMKHTLKIITIGAGVLFAPLVAKAEKISGAGAVLGCTTVAQHEKIFEANKYDADQAGQMMEKAIAAKECKLFMAGEKIIVVSNSVDGNYTRIRGPVSVRGFWVFKGRVY